MRTQQNAANRETEQRTDGGNRTVWLRRGAFIALIAAVVVVSTTVVIIGGSEPANACLFYGIPC